MVGELCSRKGKIKGGKNSLQTQLLSKKCNKKRSEFDARYPGIT